MIAHVLHRGHKQKGSCFFACILQSGTGLSETSRDTLQIRHNSTKRPLTNIALQQWQEVQSDASAKDTSHLKS